MSSSNNSLYEFDNPVVINNTTQSSSSNTGSFTTVGGFGVAKNTFLGGTLSVVGNSIFTTQTNSSQITSTVATGISPFVIASTTVVPNLNAALLNGNTFPNPGSIGSTTPSSAAFTSLTASGQITSTVSTGTPALIIASSTNVPNLNASLLNGATFLAPNAIGSTTPNTGAFTSVNTSGQITSTLATGTAPFVVSSSTNVPNLNASLLNGATFASPGSIGSTTTSSGSFTTLTTSSNANISGNVQLPQSGAIFIKDSAHGLSYTGVVDGVSVFGFQGGVLQANGTTSLIWYNNNVNIPLTTASSSASTGALTVGGGIGVAGNLNVGGNSLFGGQIISTLATGTAPLVVASTTNVTNLNSSLLNGATFASPGSIGSTTPSTGTFTTVSTGNTTFKVWKLTGTLPAAGSNITVNLPSGLTTTNIISFVGFTFRPVGDLVDWISNTYANTVVQSYIFTSNQIYISVPSSSGNAAGQPYVVTFISTA